MAHGNCMARRLRLVTGMAETDEMALPTVAASGPVDAVIVIAVLVTVLVPGTFLVLTFAYLWRLLVHICKAAELDVARKMWLVRRLERRAARLRADGSRGRRAGRALRMLASHGGDWRIAREALLRIWLASPDIQVWGLLPEDRRQQAFAAAMDPAQPAAARTQITAFCAARGLAPQEASQRALFFVLTGQQAQHRAEDADGTLLAQGYRSARDAQLHTPPGKAARRLTRQTRQSPVCWTSRWP